MTNKDKITHAFRKVKALGWIRSSRHSNTGIGKTFEDHLGIVENNCKEADIFGFEVKAHRSSSNSYVTLFTKSPSHPRRGANTYLKERFGELDQSSGLKKLHTSVFADRPNTYKGIYSFQLLHKKQEEKIYVGVYDIAGNRLLDQKVYYSYDDIQRVLSNKLHNLFFVEADTRCGDDGTEEFRYKSATIYTEPSLTKFLDMLDQGEIMYDIRIGSYKSGAKYGKTHDHGSGFRIREHKIVDLYSDSERISD